jgi:hypothetical protein
VYAAMEVNERVYAEHLLRFTEYRKAIRPNPPQLEGRVALVFSMDRLFNNFAEEGPRGTEHYIHFRVTFYQVLESLRTPTVFHSPLISNF